MACMVGAFCTIGMREYMEDRLAVLNSKDLVVGAIFDGHGGHQAAHACQQHFCDIVAAKKGGDMVALVKMAVEQMDSIITAELADMPVGTTLCAAFIDDKRIYVANVGDSRALLRSRNAPECIVTVDHKPNLKSERDRITSHEGGYITASFDGQLRVLGNLNLTRSLGDVYMRPYISQQPDISSHARGDIRYIVIGSDGLWDSMNVMKVVTIVDSYLASKPVITPRDLDECAEQLVSESIDHGSTDNVTALVILL